MPEPAQKTSDGPRGHYPGEERFLAIHNEDVQFHPSPVLPPEAHMAVLVGDPAKAAPYLTRVKVPSGVKIPPHKHPEDRIYTVMSGVFYIGLGETFDETKLMAFAPGSVIVLPGGQAHFHWAKSGEYISQISAIGPLGSVYLNPADGPGRTAKQT
jgi:quercetin dioxygenase-like cupin family protein